MSSNILTNPNPIRILYIPLEFSTWNDAKYWSYSISWGIEDALLAAGVNCFTIPAIFGISPDDPSSWLNHLEKLCAGKTFDQVWFTANHTPLDEHLLRRLKKLAPIRVGIFCESLSISNEEWQNNPSVCTQRQEIVERCLDVMTHAVVVDEADVDFLATRKKTAYWLPPCVPSNEIVTAGSIAPLENKAVFYGALYGTRKSFLEHPLLKQILVRPEQSLEQQTDLPAYYDKLQATIRGSLLNPVLRTEAALQDYLGLHRSIRKRCFALWLKTLSTASAVVNLPQYGFMYSGRIAEAMAAGSPVIATRICNHPKTTALFSDGQDILLYDQDNPKQLADKIQLLLSDRAKAVQMALNAQQRLRDNCLIESHVLSILSWIDSNSSAATQGEQIMTSALRLHLGCGEQYFEGYTNIDYPRSEHAVMDVKADIYADISTLNYPNNSVDEIRLHHVFEHFNRITALALMIRWYEWLKPGGKLVIETPDIEGSAKILLSDLPWHVKAATVRHLAGDQADTWAYHIDHWSPERFKRTLSLLGFTDIQTTQSNWPQEPYLANVTVIATKGSVLTRDELLIATDAILWESTVSPAERPTFLVWQKQLRVFLSEGQPLPAKLSLGDLAINPQKSSNLPLDEIHDFNQRTRDRWVADKASSLTPGTRVLDIGAGTCPYQDLFSHCDYKAHDFKKYTGEKLGGTNQYGSMDYVSEITSIPVPAASFDVILCTEVLEHVPEPGQAIQEMIRILRPGGRLLLTAPLGSGLHQLPYHFYGGFSPEWYRYWAAKTGMSVVEIIPNGGFFRLLAQECCRAANLLASAPPLSVENSPEMRQLLSEKLPRYFFAAEETYFVDQFTVGYHVEMCKTATLSSSPVSADALTHLDRFENIMRLKEAHLKDFKK